MFSTGIFYNPNLTGVWTLSFTNGTNTASVNTPGPVTGVSPPPFASSVTTSSSGSSQVISWTYPSGSVNGVFFDIFDKSDLVHGHPNWVYSKTLPGTTNSWAIPTSVLNSNHNYVIDLFGVVSRNPAAPLSDPNSLAWSQSFFDFRELPAGSPSNVYLPSYVNGAYNFSIASIAAGQTVYIDPIVATGYQYATGAGNSNFSAVFLPAVQKNPYSLSYDLGGKSYDFLVDPESWFNFPNGGVSAFDVTGIDTSNGLDPNNTTAFITGLQFAGTSSFTGTMTPITAKVPEPPDVMLFGAGLIALVVSKRRSRWRA